MTNKNQPRRLGRSSAKALAILAMSFIVLASSQARADEPSKEEYRPALAGIRIGAIPLAGFKRDSTEWTYSAGALADLQLGGALTPRYATGVGVRGTWLFPVTLTLKSTHKALNDPQVFQGTAYWFQQFRTQGGTAFRLTMGPYISQLLSDGAARETEPLIGGEVGMDVGGTVFNLTDHWAENLWLGALFSTGFGYHPLDDVHGDNDREFAGKLVLSFSLESKPIVPDPHKKAASQD